MMTRRTRQDAVRRTITAVLAAALVIGVPTLATATEGDPAPGSAVTAPAAGDPAPTDAPVPASTEQPTPTVEPAPVAATVQSEPLVDASEGAGPVEKVAPSGVPAPADEASPTVEPSGDPTAEPAAGPTAEPTAEPTASEAPARSDAQPFAVGANATVAAHPSGAFLLAMERVYTGTGHGK